MKITRNIRIMGPNWKQPIRILFNLCMLLLCIINAQAADIDRICPRMLHKIFNGYAPIGKLIKSIRSFLHSSVTMTFNFKPDLMINYVFNRK